MPIYPYSFQLPPLNVQDIPNDGAPGEFLGINVGGALDWLPAGGGGSGDMLAANNLSELTNFATARTNIGLGTASTPTFANLTLTSPSLSSSAPVTISQTWGTTGTYTAFKVVANETATAAAVSNLLELWSGNAATLKVKVNKLGQLIVPPGTSSAPSLCLQTDKNGFYKLNNGFGYATDTNNPVLTANYNSALGMVSGMFVGWSTSGVTQSDWDVRLYKDGAGQLALRNGAAAQTFRVYGAYPDTGINYARLALSCDTSGNATISTQALGTYTAGTVSINGVPVGLGGGNGSSNVAISTGALAANTTGANNVAVGFQSLLVNTGGSSNSVFGYRALVATTGGSLNVSIGSNSGRYITGGSTANLVTNNSIYLGSDTKAAASGETNQIVIGYDATGIGSNSVVLGNDSITKTALKGNVGIGTTSPTSKLHVAGELGTNLTTFDSGAAVKITNTTATGKSWLLTSGIINVHNEFFCIRQESVSLTALSIAPTTNNVGIGVNNAASKLTVGNGDIEVLNIASGLILKSPDGTRYRITVPNGGASLTITAV